MTEGKQTLFDARDLYAIRVLLHDAETFIDERHTNKADDPDCQACGLVSRLRGVSDKLAKVINADWWVEAAPDERPCPVYGEARGSSECEKCHGDIINCPVYGPGEKRRREEDARVR